MLKRDYKAQNFSYEQSHIYSLNYLADSNNFYNFASQNVVSSQIGWAFRNIRQEELAV
jgi:hypothetical protein